MTREDAIKLKGKRVHFRGYSRGCNWMLRRIEGEKAICMTPKTRKEFIGDIKDMYPTYGSEKYITT